MSMIETPTPSSQEGEEAISLVVSEADIGKRLDAFIAAHMPAHISRSRIKSLIKQSSVKVNDETNAEPNYRLKLNEIIVLRIPPAQDPLPQPQEIELDILYEDDHLIVVNKPAGMVVHPAIGNWNGTLVNALLFHCGESFAGIGGVKRPGIVHRLDKETSGVMVVAKNEKAHSGLTAQFADHGKSGPLERAYLALVWGMPDRNIGSIDAPLGRSNHNRLKQAVLKPDAHNARHAITHYSVVRALDGKGDGIANACLLECRLETGRTHQIRVHMSHIGHPLLGDQDYGKHFQTKINALQPKVQKRLAKFRRQALHAKLLGFEHPVTGEHLIFEAPIPTDMHQLLEAFDALE